jgi:hypothetical protein
MNSTEGNCATFLLKVEGVLEGLFQDMIMVGSSEAKVSFVLSLLIYDIGDILHCGTPPDGSTQSYASKQAPHIARVHHALYQVSYIVYMVAYRTGQRVYPMIAFLIQYNRGVPDLFYYYYRKRRRKFLIFG